MKKLLLSKLSLSLLLIPSLSEAATAWALTSGTVGVDTTLEFTATDTDLALSGVMTITTTNANLFTTFSSTAGGTSDPALRLGSLDDEGGMVSFSYAGDLLEDQSMDFWGWGNDADMIFSTPTVQVTKLGTNSTNPASATQVFIGDGDGTKSAGDPIELGPLQSSWGTFNLDNAPFDGGNGIFSVAGIHDFTKTGTVPVNPGAVSSFQIFGTLAVPEPSSTALIFGLGCIGFVARRRRI